MKAKRQMRKKRESALEQVKREHPDLPLATQKSIAQVKNLLARSKRLGDWNV